MNPEEDQLKEYLIVMYRSCLDYHQGHENDLRFCLDHSRV